MRPLHSQQAFLSLLLVVGCSASTRSPFDDDASVELDAAMELDAAVELDAATPVPRLTRLELSSGTLSSPLNEGESSYDVAVPLTTQTITLTLDAPHGATITINGEEVAPGAPWQSPVLTLGANEITIVISAPGRVSRMYTVTITRGGPIGYIKASNTSGGAAFGSSVAISGDTLVVGAPRQGYVVDPETGVTSDAGGAVYVFVNRNGIWSQQAYLRASNAEPGDQFGYAVAISGDTIVIGAPNESSGAAGLNGDQNDNSVEFAGAAYVFVRREEAWSQQAYLKASNPGEHDAFGCSVAVSNDTVLIAASQETSAALGVDGDQSDNSALYAGAAYVFVRRDSVWSQQAYLKRTDSDDRSFGSAVAIAGDTAAIAAESSVHVFERAGNLWTAAQRLRSDTLNDNFGQSVALHGQTLLVGAPHMNTDPPGEVFVFVRQEVGWSEQARLRDADAQRRDVFGGSVGLFGDVAVVGALGSPGNSEVEGAAYVFTRDQKIWTQRLRFTASRPANRSHYALGSSVAVSETAIVFGSPGEASDAIGIGGDDTNQRAWGSGAVYALSAPL